ncbi:NAD(+) diphosphatase [Microbacterium sp. zg.Y1090]|uniref:NAD(+) diphosphatase n=1 Tax=Microbacterium TaxID=33882 RepID=UPI00214BF295|nr:MULTISPECIES: NAD(+) diphosphatase [unclassified Microbacterium]MCR2812056.1 NAD(+) diphosphatase [Microbacterium sp. zg.Y1084]MCR2818505.1 NAD(+) diphosphatase [Microbacterium sp. zg.Y1090]MDL5486318.1 NAD(+) diphosphatase [Microbacterium sp. zg-Y1211]WIM29513.1 NAD(+) diphosphatase [Microbacterium sp. zg-Y1090]
MTVPDSPQPLWPLASGLDRAAEERADEGLIDRLRADAGTRVLVLHGDRVPLASDAAIAWVTPAQPEGPAVHWAFLGRDADGAALLLAAVAADAPVPHRWERWGALRTVGGDLAGVDAPAFATGLSLGRWLVDAPFCPACGSATRVHSSGWARTCTGCGRQHFPRTDPAVIVAVSSPDRKRLLLGSNALWAQQNRYSTFAGFVEAGESLESAVAREVHEEAGVRLSQVRYGGSQAWPYPRSLMLGFHAVADDEHAARADGEEIVAVRWFDRAEIGAALGGGGEVLLPGPASIARRLITQWHAEAR